MLGKKSKIRLLLFSTAEHGSIRILDAVLTLLLIRALNVRDFAALVLYQSWVAIALLFMPALENSLYRSYGKLRSSGELGKQFQVFRFFNLVKGLFAVILVVSLAWIPIHSPTSSDSLTALGWRDRALTLGFAFFLPLSQALYGIYREPLRFELKASQIFWITFAQKATLALGVLALAAIGHASIEWISAMALAVLFFFGKAWSVAFESGVPIGTGASLPTRALLKELRTVLFSVVLWIHLNGAITVAVQTLDVYFLGKHGYSLAAIGLYGIALKAVNFLQVAALPFAQVLTVHLGRTSHLDSNRQNLDRVFATSTALFLGIGITVFGAGYLLATPILTFLANGKYHPDELLMARDYYVWLLAGVCIYLQCFASGALISSRGNIRGFCVWVAAPWLLGSTVLYWWASKHSILAAAQMNAAVYALFFAGHIIYYFLGKRKNA
jgi:O-antigen/teichoic acid export membrane protein